MDQSVLESGASIAPNELGAATESSLPSYRPTPWRLVNQILDIVDSITHGKAGLFQRFFTFVCIGGFAALFNLAVFATVMYAIPLPISEWLHNIVASVFAAELSIMANFIPNDYFTFRGLAGHERSWYARCLRFHVTSIGGSVLTFFIQAGFRYIGHTPALVGQAAALLITLFYNFAFHHLFTYRHVKPAKIVIDTPQEEKSYSLKRVEITDENRAADIMPLYPTLERVPLKEPFSWKSDNTKFTQMQEPRRKTAHPALRPIRLQHLA